MYLQSSDLTGQLIPVTVQDKESPPLQDTSWLSFIRPPFSFNATAEKAIHALAPGLHNFPWEVEHFSIHLPAYQEHYTKRLLPHLLYGMLVFHVRQ